MKRILLISLSLLLPYISLAMEVPQTTNAAPFEATLMQLSKETSTSDYLTFLETLNKLIELQEQAFTLAEQHVLFGEESLEDFKKHYSVPLDVYKAYKKLPTGMFHQLMKKHKCDGIRKYTSVIEQLNSKTLSLRMGQRHWYETITNLFTHELSIPEFMQYIIKISKHNSVYEKIKYLVPFYEKLSEDKRFYKNIKSLHKDLVTSDFAAEARDFRDRLVPAYVADPEQLCLDLDMNETHEKRRGLRFVCNEYQQQKTGLSSCEAIIAKHIHQTKQELEQKRQQAYDELFNSSSAKKQRSTQRKKKNTTTKANVTKNNSKEEQDVLPVSTSQERLNSFSSVQSTEIIPKQITHSFMPSLKMEEDEVSFTLLTPQGHQYIFYKIGTDTQPIKLMFDKRVTRWMDNPDVALREHKIQKKLSTGGVLTKLKHGVPTKLVEYMDRIGYLKWKFLNSDQPIKKDSTVYSIPCHISYKNDRIIGALEAAVGEDNLCYHWYITGKPLNEEVKKLISAGYWKWLKYTHSSHPKK